MAIPTSPRAHKIGRTSATKATADNSPTSCSSSIFGAQPATKEANAVRPHLIPASDWNKHHAWPPIGGLRHLIFHAASNGFDHVIRRVGRRVLIDEAAFFAWVDGNGGAK